MTSALAVFGINTSAAQEQDARTTQIRSIAVAFASEVYCGFEFDKSNWEQTLFYRLPLNDEFFERDVHALTEQYLANIRKLPAGEKPGYCAQIEAMARKQGWLR